MPDTSKELVALSDADIQWTRQWKYYGRLMQCLQVYRLQESYLTPHKPRRRVALTAWIFIKAWPGGVH